MKKICPALFLVAFGLLAGAVTIRAQDKLPPPAPVAARFTAPTNPVPRTTVTNWISKHEALVAQAKQGGIDLLFLGDSITAGWSGRGKDVWDQYYGTRRAASFGIGGDHTQHVLWRIENGELDGIKPKVVVLLIGTNNSGTDDPSAIAEGIRLIIQAIQQKSPDTKVLLMAIFPRNKPDHQPVRMETIRRVNQIIAGFDNGRTVRFMDIGAKFAGVNGRVPAAIMPDFLHPNADGYQIWASAIEGPLTAMLGGSPASRSN